MESTNGITQAMTVTNGGNAALTMASGGWWGSNMPARSTTGWWVEPNNYYHPYPYVQYWPAPAVQTWCAGEVHVFACEHADKCRCGKASRTPAPKKCGACGK